MTPDDLGAGAGAPTPPADPFDGFFVDEHARPAPGGLVDMAAARAWFRRIGWGMERGVYTYQQPLAGPAGPRVTVGGRPFHMISSYDYLGLIGHPAIDAAAVDAVQRYGTGTGGVRMLTGTTELHLALEAALARFIGVDAAITFSSGFAANLAAIAALFGPNDRVVADERAHRSILDAVRQAGARLETFAHNDPAALAERLAACAPGRTLVAVEGIYSMDGDICPLPEIAALARRAGAFLLVDEAHSFGVLGATGRGVAEHFGLGPDTIDIVTGSLGKAIPASGGFVAGSRELVYYLQHGAAPFMFSAALSPPVAGAALAALGQIMPERLATLRRNTRQFRDGLARLGYEIGGAETPLIPLMTGSDERAYALARSLHDEGVLASAAVPPAVRRGGARLRLCATAAQTPADLDAVLAAFARAAI